MLKFNLPTNLNGAELRNELRAAGIEIADEKSVIVSDGFLYLVIANKDKTKAEEVVANHNGTVIPPEPTIEDKLASVGLSLSDLKLALGL